jgi:hypothetical protein
MCHTQHDLLTITVAYVDYAAFPMEHRERKNYVHLRVNAHYINGEET